MMEEKDVIILYISFHMFLVGLVRPFSLSFSRDLFTAVQRVLKDLVDKGAKVDNQQIQYYYNIIESYRDWEGGLMYFLCSFWIFAILIGAIFSVKMVIPTLLQDKTTQLVVFVLFFLYLMYSYNVILRRFDFLYKHKGLLVRTICMFYVIPAFAYLVWIFCVNWLMFIFILWILSILYLLAWHFLSAKFPPLISLKRLCELTGYMPNE